MNLASLDESPYGYFQSGFQILANGLSSLGLARRLSSNLIFRGFAAKMSRLGILTVDPNPALSTVSILFTVLFWAKIMFDASRFDRCHSVIEGVY